jgi:hypothetical protein
MIDRLTRYASLFLIGAALVCICGCACLQPLEPGGSVYPPGKHPRYDMVPQHYHAVGIPVTGVRGDPSQLRITIQDQYNPAVVFDSEVTPIDKGSYLLYELERPSLADRYEQRGIQNPPAQVTVKIKDKRDAHESFIMRWFRWWGRSDTAEYFISR